MTKTYLKDEKTRKMLDKVIKLLSNVFRIYFNADDSTVNYDMSFKYSRYYNYAEFVKNVKSLETPLKNIHKYFKQCAKSNTLYSYNCCELLFCLDVDEWDDNNRKVISLPSFDTLTVRSIKQDLTRGMDRFMEENYLEDRDVLLLLDEIKKTKMIEELNK